METELCDWRFIYIFEDIISQGIKKSHESFTGGKCEKENCQSRIGGYIDQDQQKNNETQLSILNTWSRDTKKKYRPNSCHENICRTGSINPSQVDEKVTGDEMAGHDRLYCRTVWVSCQESRHEKQEHQT